MTRTSNPRGLNGKENQLTNVRGEKVCCDLGNKEKGEICSRYERRYRSLILWNGLDKTIERSEGLDLIRNKRVKMEDRKYKLSPRLL